jgi:hypothetical protein
MAGHPKVAEGSLTVAGGPRTPADHGLDVRLVDRADRADRRSREQSAAWKTKSVAVLVEEWDLGLRVERISVGDLVTLNTIRHDDRCEICKDLHWYPPMPTTPS